MTLIFDLPDEDEKDSLGLHPEPAEKDEHDHPNGRSSAREANPNLDIRHTRARRC